MAIAIIPITFSLVCVLPLCKVDMESVLGRCTGCLLHKGDRVWETLLWYYLGANSFIVIVQLNEEN